MRHLKSLLVVGLAAAATSSAFGAVVAGIGLGTDTTGDVTFSVAGIPDITGTITFENPSLYPSGWAYAGSGSAPIVAYDIVASGVIFDSADTGNYISATTPSGSPSANWSLTAVQSMNIEFIAPDPDLTITGTTGNFTFDLNNNPNSPSGNLDPVPDAAPTWLLLAGACAALGVQQFFNRRSIKLA